jgi:ParB-like chromosome segregation protein Spo0J
MINNTPITALIPDKKNPRKADDARLGLLRLSLAKLGFLMPVYATPGGMLLSGHQRQRVAKDLGIECIPVVTIEVAEKDIQGINILFNRATNDFGALDTGSSAHERLSIETVIEAAEELPDFEGEEWFALDCKTKKIAGMGKDDADRYDKKAVVIATSLMRMGVQIPVVVSESGQIVNGINRLFAAKEAGVKEWPVITIPDQYAKVALNFLNYLSMDFHVDEDFARMMRYSAFRRPQNNRGNVPKAYRFWANGGKTLLDRDSYSTEYWRNFRDLHGLDLLDFGAGLCKVKPFLEGRGMRCTEFEPYRIDPDSGVGTPSPDYSRMKAREFLDEIADGRKFSSIFLASVLNSVPFPKDRMAVLAIVHALSDRSTAIYGTCRDISDFVYEYGGIRQANYFVFDSEPGVRVGDVVKSPKIQKFHTREEAESMFSRLWLKRDYWPGGNVFYFKLTAPKGINYGVLSQALELEFELPYSDGKDMGLSEHAKKCFGKRLGVKLK